MAKEERQPQDFYDTTLGKWVLRQFMFSPRAVGRRYLGNLGLNWDALRGSRVLDIGACTAGFAKEAKRHGIEVFSMDRDDKALVTFARGKRRERGVPFAHADMFHLPFSDNSFDWVLSNAVVHWAVSNPHQMRSMFNEVRRVISRPGEFRFTAGHYANLAAWAHEYPSRPSKTLFYDVVATDLAMNMQIGIENSVAPIKIMQHEVKRVEPSAKMIAVADVRRRTYDPIFWSVKYSKR